MPRQVSPESALENLKREAKRWLRALRARDDGARARLVRAFPAAPAEPTLRDVQHALALEHGLPGWTTLKSRLATSRRVPAPDADKVAWFIANACPDHHVRGGRAHVRAKHTAMRILQRFPEVRHAGLQTAIVCGDLAEVERVLVERPEAVNERGGPKGWEPLLYLCFTRLSLDAANDNAVAIARALLDRGADPRVYFMAGDSRYTPLVGAIGEGEEDRPPHPHRDVLARLLLNRGAEPYDIQVIYNTHFHADHLWFLQLIYDHTVRAGRRPDWEDPNWSMLDMGGYGSGARFQLAIAVEKNNLGLAEWLLTHGANPNAPPARDPRFPKVSLRETALRNGLTEMADLLERYGARPGAVVLQGEDAFVAACFRVDRAEARALIEQHPEHRRSARAMLAAAKRDRVDVVELLLELGVSPDVEDEKRQRGLHFAAYFNAIRVARLLIERGAAIDPVESNWGNTPLASAAYAQHPRMIELLGRVSRDIWELTYSGNVARLRELLVAEPALATAVADGHTPLMWLPPDDEVRAMEIAELLLAHGADPTLVDEQGETAADRADRLGMFEVAELLRAAPSASAASGSR